MYQYLVKYVSFPWWASCFDWAKFQRQDSGVTAGCRHSTYANRGIGVSTSELERTGWHGKTDVTDNWNDHWTAWTSDRHCGLECQLYERRALIHLNVVYRTLVLFQTKMWQLLHDSPCVFHLVVLINTLLWSRLKIGNISDSKRLSWCNPP